MDNTNHICHITKEGEEYVLWQDGQRQDNFLSRHKAERIADENVWVYEEEN